MTSLWDDIAKTIREGVDTVVEKTEEFTRIGRIKVDILNIKRNIEKNFTELGGKVYHLIVEEKKSQITSDKEIKEIIDCVKLLEKELEEKNKELEAVKTKEGKAGSATAKPAAKAAKTKTTKSSGATRKSSTSGSGSAQSKRKTSK